jgi:hypothetical protein
VDDALLTIAGGMLAGHHAVIAPTIFQIAAGMVDGTGCRLNIAGKFTIGKQGGVLTVWHFQLEGRRVIHALGS